MAAHVHQAEIGLRVALSAREAADSLVGQELQRRLTVSRQSDQRVVADAGAIRFAGAEVPPRPGTAFRRRAQIVFQNPDSSLNPRHTVEQALLRPLVRFGLASGAEAGREVDRLLTLVRLNPSYRNRYPHQMSGGEKQRIGIARALASRPDFLVCDEAVSALDVSVQAAVLNLLADLRDELGVALLFISHDIGVVSHIADRIAVMYRGVIVEEGPAAAVLSPPYHPYTQALLSAVPEPDPTIKKDRILLEGDIPSPVNPPSGCLFHTRCAYCTERCRQERPEAKDFGNGHMVKCHLAEKFAGK